MPWNETELLRVSICIQSDRGYSANVGIECPVCGVNSLDYEQFTLMDAVAWCRECKTGYQQGRGAALAQTRQCDSPS